MRDAPGGLCLPPNTHSWYLGAVGKNTSVTLGDHFGQFVDRQVEGGRYSSASEVIRAGLRLLEEREAGVQALRAALTVGEASGPSTAFDFEAFIEGKRDALS